MTSELLAAIIRSRSSLGTLAATQLKGLSGGEVRGQPYFLRYRVHNVPSTVQVYAPVFSSEGSMRAQLYSAEFGGSAVPGTTFAGGIYQPLTLSGGMATATWLVLAADATKIETYTSLAVDERHVWQPGSDPIVW